MRPIFCGLGLGLDIAGLELFFKTTHVFADPFHMVACLFLPVTQVTKFLTSLSLDLLFFSTI